MAIKNEDVIDAVDKLGDRLTALENWKANASPSAEKVSEMLSNVETKFDKTVSDLQDGVSILRERLLDRTQTMSDRLAKIENELFADKQPSDETESVDSENSVESRLAAMEKIIYG